MAELRRSRDELAQLRAQIASRGHDSGMAQELARQEQALLEVEQDLLVSLDERRARAAVLKAQRQATEAELWADDPL